MSISKTEMNAFKCRLDRFWYGVGTLQMNLRSGRDKYSVMEEMLGYTTDLCHKFVMKKKGWTWNENAKELDEDKDFQELEDHNENLGELMSDSMEGNECGDGKVPRWNHRTNEWRMIPCPGCVGCVGCV